MPDHGREGPAGDPAGAGGPVGGEVLAAGGVVTRTTARGVEVLAVHRPRYGDWCLPKGKLQPGEDFAAAARREVEEESGVRCELLAAAGDVTYCDGAGRPKRVRFFFMRAVAGDPASRPPDGEVDVARWLPLAAARRRLTHAAERALLGAVRSGGGPP